MSQKHRRRRNPGRDERFPSACHWECHSQNTSSTPTAQPCHSRQPSNRRPKEGRSIGQQWPTRFALEGFVVRRFTLYASFRTFHCTERGLPAMAPVCVFALPRGRPFAPRPALHRALDDEVRSRRAEPRSGAARRSERRPPRLCFAFSLSAPEIEAVGARHAGGLSNAVA